ncbi:MAG: PQQ-like beta-propeller repeat protein, partial [Myxococcales bacterium]
MKARTARVPLVFGLFLMFAMMALGCSESSTEQRQQVEEFDYAVPMDSESPWPKFRRTAMQTGRSPVLPIDTGADPWVFETGKGIFSTAVIDGDNNVYVGSGNRVFYKLDKEGNELWSV